MRILFVCLGNICRSPAAEAVFDALLMREGLEHLIACDSAGTSSYHQGEQADARMRAAAGNRGYRFKSRSRPLVSKDFDRFDLIVAMDDKNFWDIAELRKSAKGHAEVVRMCDFRLTRTDAFVPDPYYGGATGFERVLDILEDACAGLLQTLKTQKLKSPASSSDSHP